MKTTLPKKSEIIRKWYLVDATDQPAGRLAVKLSTVLRGKNKPLFTPHVDMGDFVVVINAKKVLLTGSKDEQKVYKSYSGFPGGLKQVTAGEVRKSNPSHIVAHAVKNMLPKNHMSVEVFKRLKVYAGAEHPHAAQKPETLEL